MGTPIEEIQDLARTRGRLCLSGLYINSKSKLRWQCKKGHRWQATPFSVKIRKSWSVSADNIPDGIAQMLVLTEQKKIRQFQERMSYEYNTKA